MKTRKALSVVLCFATLLSVLACCLMGTASAKTYANYQDEVLLTFDGDSPYGIPFTRYKNAISYHDGYVTIEGYNGNYPGYFIGKDGTVGATPTQKNDSALNDSNKTEADKAINELFLCNQSDTYRLSFKYRVVSANTLIRQVDGKSTTVSDKCGITIIATNNPVYQGGQTYTTDGSGANGTFKVTDIIDNSGDHTKSDWKEFSFTFKGGAGGANNDNFAIGLRMFGDVIIDIDELKIQKEISSVSCGTTTGKLHTMTGETVGNEGTTDAKYDVWPTSGDYRNFSSVAIIKDDEQHGDVLKIVGNGGNPRVSLNDFTIQKGHKYYITYEAKADTEAKLTTVMCVSGNSGSRYFISDATRTAVKYYIEGTEYTNPNDFKATTAWRSYGIYIDLTNNSLIDDINLDGSCTDCLDKNQVKAICFGAANTTGYFDNMQIFDVTDMELTLGEGITDKSAASYYSLRKANGSGAEYTPAGIRFKGYIPTETAEAAAEIGFVVTPSAIAGANANWYKIDNTDAITAKYVNGTYYDKSGDNTGYQVLITGLSTADGKTAYEMSFAAALYTKDTDGNYTYYYIGQASYNEILGCYTVNGKDIPTK